MTNSSARWLLFPSSYGFVIWVILLIALPMTDVQVGFEAGLLLAYVPVCFAISNVLNRGIFPSIIVSAVGQDVQGGKIDRLLFLVSLGLGSIGLWFYVSDFSAATGGIAGFFVAFFGNPLEIRGLAQEMTSVGFQLSYFSWIAFFYCAYFLASPRIELKGISRWALLCLAVALFVLNLLFVDRTRPVTLFVVAAFIVLLLRFNKIRNPIRGIFLLFSVPLAMFFLQAMFTGKYDADDGLFRNFVIYVFGGFGYFSSVLEAVNPDYEVTRILFPIAKMLQAIGLVSDLPSQILPFRDVPFSTNVGTFLEPLVSDGGWPFVVFGAPVLIVVIDFIALKVLLSRTISGLFLWANLVLVVILSFFVPKYNSTYLYFFFVIYFFAKFDRLSSQNGD